LRSPLTPIRGFVQLVARDLEREGGHAAQVGWLRSIEGYVDRMTRLVDDLLDVSRLRVGRLAIRKSPVDLVAICRQVVHASQPLASHHQLAVQTIEPSLIGDWDGDRLHQVVDNLVSNAIKYSPGGGKVTISVRQDAAHNAAVVQVEDEGPGIRLEDREQIFTAFHRTADATASRVPGLGLGLFICHELVAAHGGTIGVGEAWGGGCVFTIRLPMEAAPALVTAGTRSAAAA
jgi:signal transduction histidine kinase